MSDSSGLSGLSKIRTALEMSQSEAAEAVGLSTDFLRHLETGYRDCSLSTLRQIAKGFKCKPADLLEPADEARLAEIKANFFQARADEARAAADRAKGAA